MYFITTMILFSIIAYTIYYRYTIYSKIFVSSQLIKLGVYARIYNYFEEKTSKENAALFAEVINDEIFSEKSRREKSVLFHVIHKEEIMKTIFQLVNDFEIKEMINTGLYAEAIINMKNGMPRQEAMQKLNNLKKFALEIENIEKKYPLKISIYNKANRFYRLTKSDAVKARLGKK